MAGEPAGGHLPHPETGIGGPRVPAGGVGVRGDVSRPFTWSSAWFRPAGIAYAVALAVYAWWATGLQPFTARAYVAVGVPVIVLTLVAVAVAGRPDSPGGSELSGSPGGRHLPRRAAFPWLLFFVLVAGLEGVGLALGGRSTSVPTLSTVVDHALAWHAVRFFMFCGWLAVGWAPVVRVAFRAHGKAA